MGKYGFAKGYAQTSYERLILTQLDIEFQGLWYKDDVYFIACDTVESATTESGMPIRDWFDTHCRVIAYQVDLVAKPPQGSTRVPSRTPQQLSQLNGAPLNSGEFYQEIKRQLPKDFPAFGIDDSPAALDFTSESPLSEDECLLIEIAVANMGIDIQINFKTANNKPDRKETSIINRTDQRLKNWPSSLIIYNEEAEQEWFDNRLALFSSDETDSAKYVASVRRKRASCFLDCTVGKPSNIRNYLTAYNCIYLAPPFSGLDSILSDLAISQKELMKLVENKRVVIVLIAELHHYKSAALAELLEFGRDGLILNRQLAAATIVETRRRNPLLYPILDNENRRDLLDLIAADSTSPNYPFLNSARAYLGSSWSSLELDFSTRGARAGFDHGIGRLLAELAGGLKQGHINPLFFACSTSVEWATALNANYCPVEIPGINVELIANLTASLISGVPQKPIIDNVSHLDYIVKDLLVLNGDAPIQEILEAFTDDDIWRLNTMLKNCNYSQDKIDIYVSDMNKKIKHFEKVERGAKRRDLLGLAAAILPVLDPLTAAAYVPVGVWLAQRALDNDSGGPVSDWLKAKNAFTTSEAVFVSRLRKAMP
jgi:hypothetical protein